jgi:hypothetical protein
MTRDWSDSSHCTIRKAIIATRSVTTFVKGGTSYRGLALLLLASTLGSPAAHGDWFEAEPGRQRKSASTLMPTPIVMAKDAPAGKTRIMKIRCYADNDYRIGVIRLQDRVRIQLEAMNRVIEPSLGVRLEAESFKRWDRSADPGKIGTTVYQIGATPLP